MCIKLEFGVRLVVFSSYGVFLYPLQSGTLEVLGLVRAQCHLSG